MLHLKKIFFRRISHIIPGLISWAFCFPVVTYAQSVKDKIQTELDSINTKYSSDHPAKLKQLNLLKHRFEFLGVFGDPSCAPVVNQMADELKELKDYVNAILLRKEALRVTMPGRDTAAKLNAVDLSISLAYDYEDLGIMDKAISYYDTTVQLCNRFGVQTNKFLFANLMKASLFFNMGDYQRCLEESLAGAKYALQKNDSNYYFSFLNQQAQSNFHLGQFPEAFSNTEIILKAASVPANAFQVASALKVEAMIAGVHQDIQKANRLFERSVAVRMITKDKSQLADDYTDWGNFYFDSLHDLKNAIKCYVKVIKFAGSKSDSLRLSKACINLSYVFLGQKDFTQAVHFTIRAMQYLKFNAIDNILVNPLSSQLGLIGNKDPVIALMVNKTRLLFELYKERGETKYLTSCIETAHLTDTVITQMRYLQSGEQSKLYWRNNTRDFFSVTMEACYAADDAKNAFYFMEKSRAVLLNDKLNELGASFQLSAADAKTERDFNLGIAISQQKLNSLSINSTEYNEQKLILIGIKDDFAHFIKSLENKYPAYYNYKYSDNIPSLGDLQNYLATVNASFLHYFTNDTMACILSITAREAKISRLGKKDFSYDRINEFLSFCASGDRLNTQKNYSAFAHLSNRLYQTLFQPLRLHTGRAIICSDNFLLPFEALCTDSTGKNFLIGDYIFSYAYSATYLLKESHPSMPRGNFIGFAPVLFKPYLHLPSLKNSEPALKKSSAYYTSSLLFTNAAATKNNFIQNIGTYSVANILSHASGSTDDIEPRLYMGDSIIYLSDLRLLHQPATQLVVLSACQTNVGKYATGEGIYSLARGFAAAGIPSVSATLWKADEAMIYKVSEKFNQYLSQGMSKDSALHRSKLDFIKSNQDTEKSSPFFWANIILIGNSAPLQLPVDTANHWVLTGTGILIGAILTLTLVLRRRSGKFRR